MTGCISVNIYNYVHVFINILYEKKKTFLKNQYTNQTIPYNTEHLIELF